MESFQLRDFLVRLNCVWAIWRRGVRDGLPAGATLQRPRTGLPTLLLHAKLAMHTWRAVGIFGSFKDWHVFVVGYHTLACSFFVRMFSKHLQTWATHELWPNNWTPICTFILLQPLSTTNLRDFSVWLRMQSLVTFAPFWIVRPFIWVNSVQKSGEFCLCLAVWLLKQHGLFKCAKMKIGQQHSLLCVIWSNEHRPHCHDFFPAPLQILYFLSKIFIHGVRMCDNGLLKTNVFQFSIFSHNHRWTCVPVFLILCGWLVSGCLVSLFCVRASKREF